MSYNGSGTFLINTAGQPVVSGTVISSTAFNALTADLATGLSTAITKDGQTTVTANIPMGTYKFTGLGAGTAATDSANLSQVQSTVTKLLASVSGADTITAVGSPTLGAYAAGQMFYFVAASANTGAVTINIDSLGAKSITRDGTTALAAGDIQSGEVCVIVYDGTQFQLVNGASQSASIVTENLTVNKATVLNESGGDNDTRIEGDTDANLVFVDASTDRVGVGTSSPATKLDVNGITQSRGNLYGGTSNTTANVLAYANVANGGAGFSQFLFANTSTETRGYLTYTHASDALLIGTGGATKATLDSSGNLGLGVTPTANQFAGYKTFQIASQGLISSDSTSNGELEINNNAYRAVTTATLTYINSFAATKYAQYRGEHRWFTAPSGTAGNTISFTQAMTLSADGSLGVGTTSPAAFSGYKVIDINGSTGGLLALTSNGTNKFQMYVNGSSTTLINVASEPLIFGTNNTERARITSGGLFGIGTTNPSLRLTVSETAAANTANFLNDSWDWYCVQVHNTDTVNDNLLMQFVTDAGSGRGSITYNRTGGLVAYNTTSDYRAKDIIGPVENSGETIDALQVYMGQMHGATVARPMLIAHEAQAVTPYAVTGEKDAEKEDGTPIYQQMDHSAYVPLLIAEIQSLRARVAALEAK